MPRSDAAMLRRRQPAVRRTAHNPTSQSTGTTAAKHQRWGQVFPGNPANRGRATRIDSLQAVPPVPRSAAVIRQRRSSAAAQHRAADGEHRWCKKKFHEQTIFISSTQSADDFSGVRCRFDDASSADQHSRLTSAAHLRRPAADPRDCPIRISSGNAASDNIWGPRAPLLRLSLA